MQKIIRWKNKAKEIFMTTEDKIKSIGNKVVDYFNTDNRDEYPYFRVVNEQIIQIDGYISLDDMKELIKIFENGDTK
jgi:hypothetical protein